jgi:hypothetical protein
MALMTMATDLNTREIVWVTRNIVKGRPQLNSHRGDGFANSLAEHGIDGLSAVELAGLHTDYQGWQHKQHQFYCNPEAKRLSFAV